MADTPDDWDALDDFVAHEVTYDAERRTVYRKGDGPAVIVISEIPGITPAVADFARRVVDLGCTVAMPSLFGEPGRPMSTPYAVQSLTSACVSKEFATWAAGRTSPVTVWLRHLARDLHDELGGPGVGVVGMCLTGGFALAMMVDDEVVAPVLSQPSLPFPVGKGRKRDLGISAEDLARVKERVDEGICVLGLRFTGDPVMPADRFARLRESIRLMRELWTADRVTFEGEYYRTLDAAIYDRPAEPVPVYVAAGGPLVARYAGRVADGFICTSGKGHELYAEQLVPAVDEGLDLAGRDRGSIDRMIEIKVSWDPDPELALSNTRFWAPLSLSAEQKHSIQSPAEMERAADSLPIEQVARRWVVASRPSDVVSALRVYTDLGFDHLVVHGPGHDQERFLSTFAEQVLPELRELVPASR